MLETLWPGGLLDYMIDRSLHQRRSVPTRRIRHRLRWRPRSTANPLDSAYSVQLGLAHDAHVDPSASPARSSRCVNTSCHVYCIAQHLDPVSW